MADNNKLERMIDKLYGSMVTKDQCDRTIIDFTERIDTVKTTQREGLAQIRREIKIYTSLVTITLSILSLVLKVM